MGEASHALNMGEASQPLNMAEASQALNMGEASRKVIDSLLSPLDFRKMCSMQSQLFTNAWSWILHPLNTEFLVLRTGMSLNPHFVLNRSLNIHM